MEANVLQLSVEGDSSPVIRAAGELNYLNCDSLGAVIRDALSRDVSAVGLALGELDFVDSSGLRILVTAAQEAGKLGRSISIVSLTPQLSHMLDVSGFRCFFDHVAAPPGRDEPESSSPAAIGSHCFEITAEPAACRSARNGVCDFAESAGFDSVELADIKLAVGEAISNAVRHGMCDGEAIQIRCEMGEGRLRVSLRYPSAVFDAHSVPAPDSESLSEGGMGIYFMRLAMDGVKYEFEDGCVVLTLEKRVKRSHSPRRRKAAGR